MMVLGSLEVYLDVDMWMWFVEYLVVEVVQGGVGMVVDIVGCMVDGSCCCIGYCKAACKSGMLQLARPYFDNN